MVRNIMNYIDDLRIFDIKSLNTNRRIVLSDLLTKTCIFRYDEKVFGADESTMKSNDFRSVFIKK